MGFDMTLVAEGATLGSAVPMVGTAIGAGVGALAAVAGELFPETVGKVLSGPQASDAAAMIGQAVQAATGTTDAAEAKAALMADPAAALALEQHLADVAVQFATLDAADRKDARAATTALAAAGSRIAWVGVGVDAAVWAIFGFVVARTLIWGLPPAGSADRDIVIALIAAAGNNALTDLTYWRGSSAEHRPAR